MFTGLIEKTAKVVSIKNNSLTVSLDSSIEANIGDSVAVNGVCLTVTEVAGDCKKITFDVSHETISVTNFEHLSNGSLVNIERPLKSDGRFHGHMVLGHVDNVGKITKIDNKNGLLDIYIKHDAEYSKWVTSKGSIAIDGISLTVNECSSDTEFRLTIIPHTIQKTTLSQAKVGNFVNIEFDIIAKYLESLIKKSSSNNSTSNVNDEYLRRMGYGL